MTEFLGILDPEDKLEIECQHSSEGEDGVIFILTFTTRLSILFSDYHQGIDDLEEII